jgi:hypothetical protein
MEGPRIHRPCQIANNIRLALASILSDTILAPAF